MTIYRIGLACTLCTLGIAAPKPHSVAGYGSLPVHFESNRGQWDDGSLYTGIASNYRFAVDPQGFRLSLHSGSTLAFRFSHSNPSPALSLRDPLPGQSTYLLGPEPRRQFSAIDHYRRVHAASIYPGIDAVYYSRGRNIEYDFIVAPHASPEPIALRISGASRIAIDAAGDLLLDTPSGQLRQHRPVAYQWAGPRKQLVQTSYKIVGGAVTFALGPYDRNLPLIIDPTLAYSVYFTTGGFSQATAIDVDSQGSAYVTGYVRDGSLNRGFVIKLNPTGDTVLSALYFSGGLPNALRIDTTGAAYIAGYTDTFPPGAGTLPVKKAIQSQPRGGYDFFVAKVAATANEFDYCTYLGGARNEGLNGTTALAIDAAGSAYLLGTTDSADMPLAGGPIQPALRGSNDAYIARINPAGDRLDFATYYGTTGNDTSSAMVLDRDGLISVALQSDAINDLPRGTTNHLANAAPLSYFAKLTPLGTSIPFTGLLPIVVRAMRPEPSGDLLLAGASILRLNAAATAIATLRQLGTTNVRAITTDPNGFIYAAATGNASDFLLRQIMGPGGGFEIFADAYLIKLTPDGVPVFATYVSGSENDIVTGLAVDSAGAAYLAGYTESNDYPQAGLLSNKSSQPAAFLTKIIDTPDQRLARVLILAQAEAGVKYTIDGIEYDRTKAFVWTPGSAHTLSVPDSQIYRGVRYRFLKWSQGGAASQTYTVPDRDTNVLTLEFERSIFVEANVNPPGAGVIQLTPAPPADGYYLVGASITATVIPNPGFTLAGWTGRATGASSTVSFAAVPDNTFIPPSVTANLTSGPQTHATAGLGFVPVRPCRVADTRTGEGQTGAFGPPHIAAQSIRTIPIPQSACGIPSSAKAFALNVTVVPLEPLAYISLWPTGRPQPLVSTLNAFEGQVAANAAIVPAGDNGAIDLYASNNTHAIVDINGYFTESTGPDVLYYSPLAPCRRADTRNTNTPLAAAETRAFPIAGACAVPANARAFALNVTAVPRGPLAYISAWPTGTPQPLVSTLNSFQGRVVANAAIVPSGANGSISIYASNSTDLILDVNGYFAPLTPAALRFFPVQPCRIADTRPTEGFTAPNGPPILNASEPRTLSMLARCALPNLAQAYSLNVTVVPTQTLGFLSLFPASSIPTFGTSNLNAFEGQIVANAAIVRGNAGAISAFVSNPTHLILDVNGYFAP
ncbi:MAG: SBBP repeat-containing protein [Bryobacterales bacterium]|nr:SBBP repeat-containing protein [Bryobacterales bacterium]